MSKAPDAFPSVVERHRTMERELRDAAADYSVHVESTGGACKFRLTGPFLDVHRTVMTAEGHLSVELTYRELPVASDTYAVGLA